MRTFVKNHPIRVVWRILKPDGSPFGLENYKLSLSVSSGRGSHTVDFSIMGDAIVWYCMIDKRYSLGFQDLRLDISDGKTQIGSVRYNNAFKIVKCDPVPNPTVTQEEIDSSFLSLVSIADFTQVADYTDKVNEHSRILEEQSQKLNGIDWESIKLSQPGEILTKDKDGVLRPQKLALPMDDKNYIHNQGTPEKTWEIAHNLGKIPSITVIDSIGRIVIGDVVYDNQDPLNKLTITFSGEFSGKATLN